MKIVVDASYLNEIEPTGTQNFLYELLLHLAQIDSHNDYIVCHKDPLPIKFKERVVNENSNFSFKLVKKFGSWTHVSFAHFLFKSSPDVIICPWHTVPVFRPKTTKVVSIIHDLYFVDFKRVNFLPVLHACIAATRLVAVSKHTKGQITSKFKISKDKIAVVYEGINTQTFFARSTDEIAGVKKKYGLSNKYVLSVGTLNSRKNVPNMIRAFAKISDKIDPTTTYVFVGKQSPSLNYQDLTQNLGIDDKVRFLGYVPSSDLPILLSGASMLAYVSKDEGFGLPILESMACETPVLTSSVSSTVEVGGNAAYYAHPDDLNQISQGMYKLLTDKTLHANLIDLGKLRVKDFSWEKTANSILNVLSDI